MSPAHSCRRQLITLTTARQPNATSFLEALAATPGPANVQPGMTVAVVGDGAVGVFGLTLPLDQVAEAYRAMHKRRAIKVLLRP
jgi:threonine dehydrogenase-like Zn-dependent dehydrogenase